MLTLDFTFFPEIYTERLFLRQVEADDANQLFLLRSDKRVMRFLDRPLAASVQDALELIGKIKDGIKNEDAITWAICLQNEKKLIGTIGFWKIQKEHYRAEIGYMLAPALQGKGIMQEAMTAVLDYGFKTIRLHSVEANVNPHNSASIQLLERNGFAREAYYRENYYYEGKFLDTVIYSLLAPPE